MGHFAEQALIFFAAAILLVPLFHRLGLGSVLGYLIAGMVVGPFGFGFIPDSESILHFSEIGVVFLLFIIGLEIQPRKLWSMRRHLFGFGFFQVALTTVIISLIAKAFGLSWISSGIIGFSLSLSSTAFAVQTLTEKNQFNTDFGRNSFAILLMQDLLAIPVLALVSSFSIDGVDPSASSAWMKVIYAAAIVVFLILLSRYVMRPVFRMIASTHSREVFTAIGLFVVLGVAALMQKAGLSAALGTFLAGVLLADSEYRHELEANLEPFKGLLMGLFFIAVGMSVSLDLILQEPLLILGLSIGYLILKSTVIYGLGRFSKMGHQSSKMMALAIAQGGEFAFVLLGALASMQVADSKIINYLTVVITFSMALNPLNSLANEFLSKAKKITPEYDEIKDEAPEVIIAGFGRFGQTFGRILRAQDIPFVAIDHDPQQVDLVRRFGNQVYYGDASRKELLETAGAERAKYFILAIDDVEFSVKTAELVKTSFPNLKIFARARNRGHAFDLMDLGITNIKRETFDSSVNFTKQLLLEMGFEKQKADHIIERFKTHDEVMIREQFKVRQDDKSFISVSKQGVAQLAQVLNDDSRQTHIDLNPPGK
jgi:monovalent cation:proton antiporter-2 (CPA2) family protein